MTIGKNGNPVHPFRPVPDMIWRDRALKDFDIRLFCALRFYARNKPDCWPSNGMIADLMGVSESTIKRGLARLEQAGYLTREQGGNGRVLTLASEEPDADSSPVILPMTG